MGSFREKSQMFIMGLMAGLIISGAFFILKLDDYFKELNFYKNIVKTFTFKNEQKVDEMPEKNTETTPVKEKKTKDVVKNKVVVSDSLSVKKSAANLVLDADTIAKHSVKDSAVAVHAENGVSQEDIVIRKDELLQSKTVEVVSVETPANIGSSKDSLLQKVSGVKEDKVAGKLLVHLELWQSPLNYKGYKMSKYKVVLYGMQSAEGIKLYTLGNDTYLKSGSTVYKLENTSEFKPYERVNDEALISKLK